MNAAPNSAAGTKRITKIGMLTTGILPAKSAT